MQTAWQSVLLDSSAPRSRRRGLRSPPVGDPARCWGWASRRPVAGTAVSGVATTLMPLATVSCRLPSFWEAAACGASRSGQLMGKRIKLFGTNFVAAAWKQEIVQHMCMLTFRSRLLMLQSFSSWALERTDVGHPLQSFTHPERRRTQV